MAIEFIVDAIDPVQIDYGNGRLYPAIFDMRAMAYVEKAVGTGHLAFAQKLVDNTYTLNELAALATAMHRSAGVKVNEEQILQTLNFQNYMDIGAQLIDAMINKLPRDGGAGKNSMA